MPLCHPGGEWGGRDGTPPKTEYSVFIYLTPNGDNRGNCGSHNLPTMAKAVEKAIGEASKKLRSLGGESDADIQDASSMFGEAAAPF